MISLVIPIYNEADNLPLLCDRVREAAISWNDDYEVIFVDDGSTDSTAKIVTRLAEKYPHVRIIRLSRNFGHQAAVSAGLDHAKGDAVVVLDGDLQDPPEVIHDFIRKWKEGYDVVYAIRRKRKEGILKRIAYASFYRLLAVLSDFPIPLDSGDFCLMDRKVVEVIKKNLPERIRFIRGLRAFAGFRQYGLEYERDARASGKTKYTLRKLVKLSIDGLFGFSLFPLRLAAYLGFFIAVPSFLVGLFFAIHRIFNFPVFGKYATDTPGLASLAVGVFFLGGVMLIILGIIGEYIGRIYLEVKGRPTYIVGSVSDANPSDTRN